MAWIVGVLGGLVGGTIALIAGAVNDARTSRRERRARIEQLCADVLATSGKIADSLMQTQVKRMEAKIESPELPAPTLDWPAVHGLELAFDKAFIEASWHVKFSRLGSQLRAVDDARGELVRHWSVDHPAFTGYWDELIRARATLDGTVEYYRKLNAGQANEYLQTERLPSPPPLGARPADTKRKWPRRNFP